MDMTEDHFEKLKKLPVFKGKIVTGSMIPVIKIGESIVVEVLSENLKRFDIIVFRQNNKLVCHYVWNINRIVTPRLIQTRNLQGGYDYPISPEDYFGKVISHHLSSWRKFLILLSTFMKK